MIPAPAEDGLFADAWVALRRFKHGETRRDHRDRVWVFEADVGGRFTHISNPLTLKNLHFLGLI